MSKKLDEINKYRVNRYFDGNDQEWTDRESFDELLAHARALEAMLSDLEWVNNRCPKCGCAAIFGHHHYNCELAKLLD